MAASPAGVIAKALTLLLLGVGVGAAHSVLEPVTLRMAETQATIVTLPAATDEPQTPAPATGEDPGEPRTEPPGSRTNGAGATPAAPATPPDPRSLVLEQYLPLETTRRLWQAGAAEFIDARHGEDFARGHIPRAHLYDPRTMYQATPDWVDYFDPASTILVVYCDGGDCDASQNAVRQLQLMGFTRAHIFRDGFPAWQAAGLPVNVGEPGSSQPAPQGPSGPGGGN